MSLELIFNISIPDYESQGDHQSLRAEMFIVNPDDMEVLDTLEAKLDGIEHPYTTKTYADLIRTAMDTMRDKFIYDITEKPE